MVASNLHIFGGDDGGADSLVLRLTHVLLLPPGDEAGDGRADLPGEGRALNFIAWFLW